MSRNFFLALEDCDPHEIDVEALVTSVNSRFQHGVAAKMARQLRLVPRVEQFGTTLEPFFGSASVQALLSSKRKSAPVEDMLRGLVSECYKFSKVVGFVFVSANRELSQEWPEPQYDLTLERALEIGRRGDHWLKLKPSWQVFRFPRVEARLRRPLSVSAGEEEVTHYFRDYYVRALSPEQAEQLVREDLEADEADLVDAGDALVVDQSDAEVLTTNPDWSGDAGVIKLSGRIYFSQ